MRPCPICGLPDGFHDAKMHLSRGILASMLYTSRQEPTGRTQYETGEEITQEVWRRPDGMNLPYLRGKPAPPTPPPDRPRIYVDMNDWWVGYYRGDTHHYVCLLPTVVIRWKRGHQTLR